MAELNGRSGYRPKRMEPTELIRAGTGRNEWVGTGQTESVYHRPTKCSNGRRPVPAKLKRAGND